MAKSKSEALADSTKPRASATAYLLSVDGCGQPHQRILFQGVYGKLLAFCMERKRTRLHVRVRTDKVDSFTAFEEAAAELVDYGAKIKKVTGFDRTSKKVISGMARSPEVPPEAHLPITIEHLELRVMDDSDGLVVTADVIANSLVYLFRTRPDHERFRAATASARPEFDRSLLVLVSLGLSLLLLLHRRGFLLFRKPQPGLRRVDQSGSHLPARCVARCYKAGVRTAPMLCCTGT